MDGRDQPILIAPDIENDETFHPVSTARRRSHLASTGELQKTEQVIGPFQVDFATGRMMAPQVTDRRLPDCPLRSVGKYIEEIEGR